MNWLERLKKIELAREMEPTKPTKPGFVGSVAPALAPVAKTALTQRAESAAAAAPFAAPRLYAEPLAAEESASAAKAYYTHHVHCKHCIAAGRGAAYGVRCETGQKLWDEYNAAGEALEAPATAHASLATAELVRLETLTECDL